MNTISLVCRKLKNGLSVSDIAEDLFEDESFIGKISSIAVSVEPPYDTEAIYHELITSDR